MKLPAIPLHDLEGATLNFEVLQARSILDRKVATGTGTATWTASNTSALVTVSHGLGVPPTFYGAWPNAGSTVWFAGSAPSNTQVTFKGDYYNVLTTTVTFNWIAIV